MYQAEGAGDSRLQVAGRGVGGRWGFRGWWVGCGLHRDYEWVVTHHPVSLQPSRTGHRFLWAVSPTAARRNCVKKRYDGSVVIVVEGCFSTRFFDARG